MRLWILLGLIIFIFPVIGAEPTDFNYLVCGTLKDNRDILNRNPELDRFVKDKFESTQQVCFEFKEGVKLKNEINVFGTEYVDGIDIDGKVFNQLINGSGTIDDAICRTTVFFPNMTTRFIDDQLMTFAEQGVYFFDFTVPSILGVYPVIMNCQFSFRLQQVNATNQETVNGTVAGNLSGTFLVDGLFENITEVANAGTSGQDNFTLNLLPVATVSSTFSNFNCTDAFDCVNDDPMGANNDSNYIFDGSPASATFNISEINNTNIEINSVKIKAIVMKTDGGEDGFFTLQVIHDATYSSGTLSSNTSWTEFQFDVTNEEDWQPTDFINDTTIVVTTSVGDTVFRDTALWLEINTNITTQETNFTLNKIFNFTIYILSK